MTATLEYWNRKDEFTSTSEIQSYEELSANTEIEMFEKFYKMNNRLRYCNGTYYKFQDKSWQDKYSNWLDSDDYKKKSFELYYGNGIVD